ncbi:hypothetical protein ABTN18_20055 [Acinetobacter baumannii]
MREMTRILRRRWRMVAAIPLTLVVLALIYLMVANIL